MGHAKLQLKLIENKSSREAAYRNRLRGLKKKSWELSTLCDVPTMFISFDSCGKLDHWPESQEEVHSILNKYRLNSKKTSNKKATDSDNFILSEIKKKEAELNRIVLENNLLANKAINFIDSKLAEVEGRIALLKEQSAEVEIPGLYSPFMNFSGDNREITELDGFCDQNNDFSDLDELADLFDFDGLHDVGDFDMLCQDTGNDTTVDNLTLDCEKPCSYTNCEQEYEVNQSAMKLHGFCNQNNGFSDFDGLANHSYSDGLTDVGDFDMLCQDTQNDTRVDNLTLDCEKPWSYTNCEQEHEVNQSAMKLPARESVPEFNGCYDEIEDYSDLCSEPFDPTHVDFDFSFK